MPTKDAKYWSGNTVNSFPADTMVPAFLPSSDHSPSFFYAKRSQTHGLSLVSLCTFWHNRPPFTMVKYKLLSQHLSFWSIFLWGGGQILDSDRLSETQRCSWFHQDGVRYKGCSPELTSADRGTHQGKTISFVRLCSFFRTASQIQYFTVNKQRKHTYSSWFPRKFPSEYDGFSSLGAMTNLCRNCHQPA